MKIKDKKNHQQWRLKIINGEYYWKLLGEIIGSY